MKNNLFICKKDIWFNRSPNHDISLRDTMYTISRELGFEKKYESSILVFEKNKVYQVHSYVNGILVCSNKLNGHFYFDYNKIDKYLYFYSAFLDIKKWEKLKRKLKIKKLIKEL